MSGLECKLTPHTYIKKYLNSTVLKHFFWITNSNFVRALYLAVLSYIKMKYRFDINLIYYIDIWGSGRLVTRLTNLKVIHTTS